MQKCPDCGERTNTSAKVCPRCGAPFRKDAHLFKGSGLLAIAAGAALIVYGMQTRQPIMVELGAVAIVDGALAFFVGLSISSRVK